MFRSGKTALKLILGRGSMRSYSQFGEDALLGALFRSQKRGTYVDVGAYHPVLYSNTYALYRKGWQGIVVDPNADLKPLYRQFRTRDTFVNAAVGPKGGTLQYRLYKDGAYNTLSDDQAAKLSAEGIVPQQIVPVPVRTLTDIVKENGLTRIDFLNVDVEGMDADVLASYDWKIRPRIVAVEIHGFDPEEPRASAAYEFMRQNGYMLEGLAGLTVLFRDTAKPSPMK